MELHARLVHAENGLRVVEVRAHRGERSLGSALAEAATAQEAEDLAIARLLLRLEQQSSTDATPGPGTEEARSDEGSLRPQPRAVAAPAERPAAAGRRTPPPSPAGTDGRDATGEANPAARRSPDPWTASAPQTPTGTLQPEPAAARQGTTPPERDVGPASDPQEEPPADPEDWSQELTAIDLQLRRLGWNREQEGLYLQRAFGHPSRSRLTRYSDVRAYLMALEALERGSDPAVAAVPLRRSELLAQGDALLAQLGWSAEQGRAFLERELQRVSRQQLSDVQLLQFNMLLEGELLAGGATGSVAVPEGAQR